MSEKKWNYTADVVVVGSGAAAFATAITAKSNGAEVIMVEKASNLGGTTARSGGGFWIPQQPFSERKRNLRPKRRCSKVYGTLLLSATL
jgi:succinate dehydrogenase/fumarate reductase flavoprotein subunit